MNRLSASRVGLACGLLVLLTLRAAPAQTVGGRDAQGRAAATQYGPRAGAPAMAAGGSPAALAPGQAAAAVNPLQPNWVPLSADHAAYVDRILAFWDHRSSQIKRFRCAFKRWEYDPVFGPKTTFNRYGEGQVKYAAPDKGMYKVDKLLHYQAPKQAGDKPRYAEMSTAHFEHWVCDGKTLYELDHQKKRLILRRLPPGTDGRLITHGPLPFLFGAKKEEVQQRYWVRVVTPRNVKGEYWLEAYPKTREDAANFKMLHIILDEAEFLPKGLVIFDRAFDPTANPARTTFEFSGREVNWNILAQQLNIFHRNFFEPSVPSDWQRIEANDEMSAAQAGRPTSRQGTSARNSRPGRARR